MGADPSKFGLHSAFDRHNNGGEQWCQRYGRWRSVQARNLYVDDDLDQRLAVSKFLGLSESKTRTFAQFFVTLYSVRVGLVRPSQNKLIWFGDACLAFCCGVETK